MKIFVQSLLNFGKRIQIEVNLEDTVLSVKQKIQQIENTDASIMNLFFNNKILLDSNTLSNVGIVENSFLTTSNTISRLETKEQKQLAKLNLAKSKRIREGKLNQTFQIQQLASRYVGNTVVPTSFAKGLVLGRPWAAATLTNNVLTENGFSILAEKDNNLIGLE